MPDLVEIKTKVRRSIHGRAAVPALYSTADGAIVDLEGITVRWGNKIDTTGGLDGNYGEIIDGIDRLIFLDSEIADLNTQRALDSLPLFALNRGDDIVIPGYKNARFQLDQKVPADGPEETAWVVTRLRG